MRQKQTITNPLEDIISYECNYPAKFVKILVGTGIDDGSGNFIPTENQGYECITLYDKDFDELMAPIGSKPAMVFRKEDLWPFVDKLRPIIANEIVNGARVR